MNDSVKQLVVGHADAGQIRKAGMRTLRLSGAEKVAKGETSIAEVLRVAPVSSYE